MARKAYSDEERAQVKEALMVTMIRCIADRGLIHSSIDVLCGKVGISKTFFYSFFSSKEELVLHALRYQQPRLLDYARQLMEDPALSHAAASLNKSFYQLLRLMCDLTEMPAVTEGNVKVRLEKLELARRERSGEDRRVIYVAATARYEQLRKKTETDVGGYFSSVMDTLTEREKDQIIAALSRLDEALLAWEATE